MLPQSHLINITKDTFVTLFTWEIPRVLGRSVPELGTGSKTTYMFLITMSHLLIDSRQGMIRKHMENEGAPTEDSLMKVFFMEAKGPREELGCREMQPMMDIWDQVGIED